MSHRYARRTYDESWELARLAFRRVAAEHLTEEELEEMAAHAVLTGGSVRPGWEPITGFVPDDRLFYEHQIYKPSDAEPYVEKSYVRILSPRDRASEQVYFMWRPLISP